MDTEIGCFIQPEVGHAETEVQSRVQDCEVNKLKAERDILKKAAAFFAREAT